MPDSNEMVVRLDRRKLSLTATALPAIIVLMSVLAWAIGDSLSATTRREMVADAANISPAAVPTTPPAYPQRGSEINTNLFGVQLPPPPLDALPYDVREPLSNGVAVPVKKRWLWVPDGQAIRVGATGFDVPVGTMWWKEFYAETDRATFLIERRIIQRVVPSARHPDGWAFYSSYHLPEGELVSPLLLASTGADAAPFMFSPTDWLPTQPRLDPLEVRFEDARGLQYAYVFPGQIQCQVCHAGATGAYPNADEDAVQVFGLHPNNLTPESFTALVARGWLVGADQTNVPPVSAQPYADQSFDELTTTLTGVIRNNCASCHNPSPDAAASFTAFVVDPNADYSADALLALLSAPGMMVLDAHPLVTPGDLMSSEIWLRLNGLEDRRRMPPVEGGLPDPDPAMLALWQAWIERAE